MITHFSDGQIFAALCTAVIHNHHSVFRRYQADKQSFGKVGGESLHKLYRQSAQPTRYKILKRRQIIKVPHDLFKLTTADENGGLGGSVGADLRAAISLNSEVAAQERCSHIKTAFS